MPSRRLPPRAGQVVLPPAKPEMIASSQARTLYSLSDPALSELGLEEFLDELLVRVRDALTVDTVAILLLDDDAQQLVARAAKGIEEEVEQGVRIPIGRGFAGRIASERAAIFIEDVDHADILNPILREKGIRSLLGVPLIVDGQLLGVLHVGSLKPRKFGQRDLAALQVAASRAAPGIERARLYTALEHEHQVAMILQRSLLPKRLVNTLGISAAARYLPANEEVGGDWYDVFELPCGKLGVAIGDVVGHGLKAAALMGQLRTALHMCAIQQNGPARTLELVDRLLQTMPDDAMATASYAVLDPESGALRIASAGHLPPIIVGKGTARVIDVPPSAPLGAFPYGSGTEVEATLVPGEILVLYTDGLIERPEVPLSESIKRLLEVIRDASSAEDACRLAVEELVPVAGLRDDVAIVALRNTEIPSRLSLRLVAKPRMLGHVRRNVRRWLRAHGANDQDTAEVVLAVSEACTNAIEHAYSPAPAEFEVEGVARDGEVTISIRDSGHWRTARGVHRGRGLAIIDAAMDDVSIRAGATGTEVLMRRGLRA